MYPAKWRRAMTHSNRQNFSELYRAAFAERDPDKKLELLSQVRNAIDEWEQMLHNWADSDRQTGQRIQPETVPSQKFSQVA